MSQKFRKAKNVVWNILNHLELGGPIELRKEGGLKNDGWYLSFKTKKAVNKDGYPIPWFTYSSIKYIESKLKKSYSVFEYGSGSSTLWFSKYVASVTSVEHDKEWFDKTKEILPKNCNIELVEEANYASAIGNESTKYHIIVIDGIDRTNCCIEAVKWIENDGIIIFDNSEREEYTPGKEYLVKNGFKELFFIGNLPVVSHYSCTSIYYREQNIFNI